MRLIDADEAVKIIKRYDDRGLTLDEVTRITDGIAREIEAMPTVDAVPVMLDLIDREELKKSILKWLPSEDYDPEKSGLRFDEDLVISLIMEIEEQPTVDAVPVVLCEDCELHNCCHLEDIFINIVWLENPFCCVGKRKNEV